MRTLCDTAEIRRLFDELNIVHNRMIQARIDRERLLEKIYNKRSKIIEARLDVHKTKIFRVRREASSTLVLQPENLER